MTKKIYEPIKEDKKDLLETEEKPVYNLTPKNILNFKNKYTDKELKEIITADFKEKVEKEIENENEKNRKSKKEMMKNRKRAKLILKAINSSKIKRIMIFFRIEKEILIICLAMNLLTIMSLIIQFIFTTGSINETFIFIITLITLILFLWFFIEELTYRNNIQSKVYWYEELKNVLSEPLFDDIKPLKKYDYLEDDYVFDIELQDDDE